MKKSILILLGLFSLSAFADVCICQYPKEDAKYGGGYKGEIGFYKMGCSLWLVGERKCRKNKIMDINIPLTEYLDELDEELEEGEKVRVGYVGHWGSSSELVDYIKNEIVPVTKKYNVPVSVENTACYGMEDPQLVSKYLHSLYSNESNYITVEGTQTTSIGMWDKVSFAFRKADLVAFADSREEAAIYPKCEEFLNRRCTGFQEGDVGLCVDELGNKKELLCNGRVKRKRNNTIKIKKAKRWIDLVENRTNIESYIKQEERRLKSLMYRIGYEVDFYDSMLDDKKERK